MQDAMWFRSKMKWASLIVDEGHRLKNAQSKLFQLLQPINAGHRILLTGTPLQNNLDELLMLMSFVDPQKFGDGEALAERFSDLTQESSVADLHSMLSPHLLRRLKSDVLKGLPPKVHLQIHHRLLLSMFFFLVLTHDHTRRREYETGRLSLHN